MPPPSDEDDRVRRIVESCIQAADDGRSLDLGALCENDPALEERVRALLAYEPLAASLLGMKSRAETPVGLPERLGPYVIKHRIGAGGMGQVFLAIEPTLGREVALKVLPSGSLESARFRREAAIAAALDHPNIVPIHAVGEDGGFTYIAMKRLTGPGLDALPAPCTTREAASIGAAIARALQCAHEAGVVHRDVKPGNIVLDRGVPHLVDFGLARSTSFATMTTEGHILGTLPYMAPECFQKGDVEAGASADVYSLGASLHECVTGRPCFGARERGALLRQILLSDAPRLHLSGDDRGFEAIVLRALQKDRGDRFSTAGEMGAELEAWLDGRPIGSRRDSIFVRNWRRIRRHPRVALFASVLVLMALALGVALYVQEAQRRIKEAQRRINLASGIERIGQLLRDDQLGMAEEVLATLRGGAASAAELQPVVERVEAAAAVEELLDAVAGEGPPIGSGPQFLAQAASPEIMQRVERSRSSGGDPLLAGLTLAQAALRARDPERALRFIGEVEAGRGPSRATLAVRHAVEGNTSWKPPAIDSGSDVDHLFTAMVMRDLAAPQADIEKELGAALSTSSPAIHYRAVLRLALLRSDQGNYENALSLCLGLERPGHRSDALERMRALLHVQLGNSDAALGSLDKIPPARRHPYDDYIRVRLLRRKGDAAAVAAAWPGILERWKAAPEILLLKGYFAREDGHLAEALAAFEACAGIDGWYHNRETAGAEVLQCRLLLELEKAGQQGSAPDSEALERIRADAAASQFRLPYAASIALYVQSRVAEIDGDGGAALERAREAARVAPENTLASLRFAHMAFDTVSGASSGNGAALSPPMKALSVEGIEAAESLLRIDGRRVALPRGTRARARYYEAALALLGGDTEGARNAASKGLEEPAADGPEGAAVTEGLRWVADRVKSGASSR